MAGSKYAYVRNFELPDALLPSTFLLLRLDGKNFHSFSKSHNFDKPNDSLALDLMNAAAKRVIEGKELNGECVLAFGESDEFSFLFKRSCKLYGRRSNKLTTLVVSLFTSAYVFLWPSFFPNSSLKMEELPVFDGRIVQYSTEQEIKDYFRWRQVDTHINNMYNTCFWALVLQSSLTEQQAHKELSGTISSQKQELLFSRFQINYNNLPPMFRKGSILLWETVDPSSSTISSSMSEPSGSTTSSASPSTSIPEPQPLQSESFEVNKVKSTKISPPKLKRKVVVVHEDLIADAWWETGRGTGLLNT